VQRVSADAIDTGSPPAVSFLRHGPNVAAQSLLANPTLRGLAPPALGRALSISTIDARDGIASVTGMVNRIGMHGQAALRAEPTIAVAIGPFLSLDQSLARYASHRGPIVVSPSPLFRPDAGRFTDEAGDTNVSDTGDPANADQGLPGNAQAQTPEDPLAWGPDSPLGGLYGPQTTGQGDLGQSGQGSDSTTVYTDGGGGGGGTSPLNLGGGAAPSSGTTPAAAPSSGVPWYVWAGAVAVAVLVATRKKRRK
jgi:hypothetical protein